MPASNSCAVVLVQLVILLKLFHLLPRARRHHIQCRCPMLARSRTWAVLLAILVHLFQGARHHHIQRSIPWFAKCRNLFVCCAGIVGYCGAFCHRQRNTITCNAALRCVQETAHGWCYRNFRVICFHGRDAITFIAALRRLRETAIG